MAVKRLLLIMATFTVFNGAALFASAQVDDYCREFGAIPTLEGPKLSTPFVFGRVTLQGLDPNARFPKVIITLQERSQAPNRITVSRAGTYCFRRVGGDGALRVEVDGVEVDRRQFASFGTPQQREDFEIFLNKTDPKSLPAVISTKFARPPNEKTVELYRKTSEAEQAKNFDTALETLKEIVALDKEDFIAWTKLGHYISKKAHLLKQTLRFGKR